MSKFKISILKAFKDKLIEAEMESMVIKGNNLVSLIKEVGEEGYAFCPSTFKDSIKSWETFEQSQLFVVTFGNANNEGLSFIKIKSRARYYGLPMLFAYITDPFYCIDATREQLSIVFLNETSLSDLKEAEAMQRALMMIFPEADKDCSVLNVCQGGQCH